MRRQRVTRIGPSPSRATGLLVLIVVGIVFAVPLVAMAEFSLRVGGGYGVDNWLALVDPENARRYRGLFQGLGNSLVLALVSVAIVLVLLLPTMILVRLRFPRWQRVMEFICLIPITIPAIVLVVGLAPVYSVVARVLGSGSWTLAFAYGVLVLPFAYRAIQSNLTSIDVVTLSEAARSLGAGWGTVLVRVIVPNLRRGLLVASLISIAVVLGEYTIAALLNRTTLQTALIQVSRSDPYAAVAISLLSLVVVGVLLFIVGRAGGPARIRISRKATS